MRKGSNFAALYYNTLSANKIEVRRGHERCQWKNRKLQVPRSPSHRPVRAGYHSAGFQPCGFSGRIRFVSKKRSLRVIARPARFCESDPTSGYIRFLKHST